MLSSSLEDLLRVTPKEEVTVSDASDTKSSIPDGHGFDIPPEMAAKADGMWRMLDDLAETDPEAYRTLIAEATASAPDLESAKAAAAKAASGPKRRSFVPAAGFVAKLRARHAGVRGTAQKVFVNCCAHKCIDLPQNHMGQPVRDEDPSMNARHIPLLVGPLRAIEDSAGFPASVVDVVFSPWVLQWCCREEAFLQQTATLACQWVLKEHSFSVSGAVERCLKVIRCRYKGGAEGDIAGDVTAVPFYVTADGEPSRDAAPEAAPKATTPAVAPKAAAPMESPQALLSQLAGSHQPPATRREQSEATKASSSSAAAPAAPALKLKKDTLRASAKTLIEEVGVLSSSASSSSAATSASASASAATPRSTAAGGSSGGSGTKKVVVKKGFLNRRKASSKPLYEGKGSTEGFSSPFQIVDTTKMSQREKDEAMETCVAFAAYRCWCHGFYLMACCFHPLTSPPPPPALPAPLLDTHGRGAR